MAGRCSLRGRVHARLQEWFWCLPIWEWHLLRRHGEGTYTWPDGRQYKGLWNKGKQHGVGAAIDAEGQRVEFEWSQGQRVATNV
mmetsp:Transcript_128412/g.235431  ORF Transcript_128412/g.235431 Transcript_128412/m.235431 type:complete len:84 (+) Transcript_128412:609-860(+)